MRRDPWRDSCPNLPDLMSRFSRLKLSARLCTLGLNQDAAQPLARLVSRFSRPYIQTFQTQTLGMTLRFGSKSGCCATLGATHVQIFQTLCPGFPDSNSRRDFGFGSKSGCGAAFGATDVQTFQTLFPDVSVWNSWRESAICV